jgi:hypothetical protein
MLKYFYTLIPFFLFCSVKAQTIEATDMLNILRCEDTTCIGQIVEKKHYAMDESKGYDTIEVHSWSKIIIDSTTTDCVLIDMIYYMITPNTIMLDFMTFNNTTANKLIEQFKTAGFVLYNTIEEESTINYYKSTDNKYTLEFTVPNMLYDFIYHFNFVIYK